MAFMVTSLLTIIVVLVLSSLYRQWFNTPTNVLAPTEGYLSSAELLLRQGGEPLLLEWLLAFERHAGVNAYVFDNLGNSLSGQVPDAVLDYAMASDSYGERINPYGSSEILVKAPLIDRDSNVYLLVVEFIHPVATFNLPIYLALGLLFALIIFLIWSWVLSDYLTRPVRYMQRTVRDISQGELSKRMGLPITQRRDELGELGREFDEMTARIERLLSDQKQLLSDVSHELRSPLARSTIAIALARLDASEEQNELLDRIELENERLNELINDLLGMARLETEENRQTWEHVSLYDITESVVQDARFEHSVEGIRFTSQSHVGDKMNIKGQPALLVSAIENVIRNALLHTETGTSIDVSIARYDNQILIQVRDYGPGVSEDHLASLTKPFVRAESARQRLGGQHRGFGLGLAIANRVTIHHKGRLTLANASGGGLLVEFRFPI